jgi:hypothetical protein
MAETDPAAAYLAALEATTAAATEGPWTTREHSGTDIADEAWADFRVTADGAREDVAIFYLTNLVEGDRPEENAAFIITARTAIPRLLAAVEAARTLAEDWAKSAAELDAMAERASARGADPMRTTLMNARAQAHQDCAQALRAAISRELPGEGASGG